MHTLQFSTQLFLLYDGICASSKERGVEGECVDGSGVQRQSVSQGFDMKVANQLTRFPMRIVIKSDDDRRSNLRPEARASRSG